MAERSYIERIKVAGEDLVEQFERLVYEANVRRIVIKQREHTVAEFPLTVGVIGIALAPMLAAVGALAAVLTHCTIEVERVEVADEPLSESECGAHEAAHRERSEAITGEPLSPQKP